MYSEEEGSKREGRKVELLYITKNGHASSAGLKTKAAFLVIFLPLSKNSAKLKTLPNSCHVSCYTFKNRKSILPIAWAHHVNRACPITWMIILRHNSGFSLWPWVLISNESVLLYQIMQLMSSCMWSPSYSYACEGMMGFFTMLLGIEISLHKVFLIQRSLIQI